ncbi:MAG: hypothetical protein EOP07_18705 [Proteobacteria bacterium]|nr:MAG: hypothetical protein EOP07_18705 [Pseudomonadota bacterium]
MKAFLIDSKAQKTSQIDINPDEKDIRLALLGKNHRFLDKFTSVLKSSEHATPHTRLKSSDALQNTNIRVYFFVEQSGYQLKHYVRLLSKIARDEPIFCGRILIFGSVGSRLVDCPQKVRTPGSLRFPHNRDEQPAYFSSLKTFAFKSDCRMSKDDFERAERRLNEIYKNRFVTKAHLYSQ